jgi:hypothetical protein
MSVLRILPLKACTSPLSPIIICVCSGDFFSEASMGTVCSSSDDLLNALLWKQEKDAIDAAKIRTIFFISKTSATLDMV